MALQLSVHLDAEVLRARVSLMLPDERLRDLLPDDPGPRHRRPARLCQPVPGRCPGRRCLGFARPAVALCPARACRGLERLGGGPSRSAAGGTLLANDPHLGFTAPTIWYLAGWNCSRAA
jgi:penicillin G amidase